MFPSLSLLLALRLLVSELTLLSVQLVIQRCSQVVVPCQQAKERASPLLSPLDPQFSRQLMTSPASPLAAPRRTSIFNPQPSTLRHSSLVVRHPNRCHPLAFPVLRACLPTATSYIHNHPPPYSPSPLTFRNPDMRFQTNK